MHLEIGNHENNPMTESIYDQLRRDWAQRFATVNPVEANTFKVISNRCPTEVTEGTPSNLCQGRTTSKPHVATCFTAEVNT